LYSALKHSYWKELIAGGHQHISRILLGNVPKHLLDWPEKVLAIAVAPAVDAGAVTAGDPEGLPLLVEEKSLHDWCRWGRCFGAVGAGNVIGDGAHTAGLPMLIGKILLVTSSWIHGPFHQHGISHAAVVWLVLSTRFPARMLYCTLSTTVWFTVAFCMEVVATRVCPT
jgi:hypothetical protein